MLQIKSCYLYLQPLYGCRVEWPLHRNNFYLLLFFTVYYNKLFVYFELCCTVTVQFSLQKKNFYHKASRTCWAMMLTSVRVCYSMKRGMFLLPDNLETNSSLINVVSFVFNDEQRNWTRMGNTKSWWTFQWDFTEQPISCTTLASKYDVETLIPRAQCMRIHDNMTCYMTAASVKTSSGLCLSATGCHCGFPVYFSIIYCKHVHSISHLLRGAQCGVVLKFY